MDPAFLHRNFIIVAAEKLNYRFVVEENGVNRIEQDWILSMIGSCVFAQKLYNCSGGKIELPFCGRGKVESIPLQSGILLNEAEY